jgi:hypothetical protein
MPRTAAKGCGVTIRFGGGFRHDFRDLHDTCKKSNRVVLNVSSSTLRAYFHPPAFGNLLNEPARGAAPWVGAVGPTVSRAVSSVSATPPFLRELEGGGGVPAPAGGTSINNMRPPLHPIGPSGDAAEVCARNQCRSTGPEAATQALHPAVCKRPTSLLQPTLSTAAPAHRPHQQRPAAPAAPARRPRQQFQAMPPAAPAAPAAPPVPQHVQLGPAEQRAPTLSIEGSVALQGAARCKP